jgi:hypothetical protein
VTVTAPPRPPRRLSDPVERDEFEALVEALIEEARQRARRRRRAYMAVAAFLTLGAAAIFTLLDRTAEAQTASPALGAPSSLSAASKQRVEITAGGVNGPTSLGKFVLTPIGAGGLATDSGTETSIVRNERFVVRQGQSAKIVTWITTAKGKHGSFVLRVPIEHIDAGNGFHIGTGTWTFIRGTGDYANATGGGRVANAWSESSGRWSERRSGILTVR